MPITDTGYRSHFHQPGTIEAHPPAPRLWRDKGGDVMAQVIAWLDEEATLPEWRAQVDAERQGELF